MWTELKTFIQEAYTRHPNATNITVRQQGYVQNAYAALPEESTNDEDDDVQTVITQMAALTTQSKMTAASSNHIGGDERHQPAGRQPAGDVAANRSILQMQLEPHRQQSNSQPSSTFLYSATSKEAATEAVDAVDEDTGIKAKDKAYKEEEGTHAPHLQTTLHVKEVAASPLLPRNQCQDCHSLAQGLQMHLTPTSLNGMPT